jgi:hypothetical protein
MIYEMKGSGFDLNCDLSITNDRVRTSNVAR